MRYRWEYSAWRDTHEASNERTFPCFRCYRVPSVVGHVGFFPRWTLEVSGYKIGRRGRLHCSNQRDAPKRRGSRWVKREQIWNGGKGRRGRGRVETLCLVSGVGDRVGNFQPLTVYSPDGSDKVNVSCIKPRTE